MGGFTLSGETKLVYQINPSRITDSYGNPLESTDGSLNVNFPGISFPHVQNIPARTSWTEYSFTIPVNVKKFELNARFYSKIQIATTLGQSNITFKTVFPGNSHKVEGLELTNPITYYFQVSKNNEVLELILYS